MSFDFPDYSSDPCNVVADRIAEEQIIRAVNALPEKRKEVVVEVVLAGREYQDYAREIGAPIGTVKCRLFRARQKLMEELEGVVV